MHIDIDRETHSMLADAARACLKKMGGMNLARAIQRGDQTQADRLWRIFSEQGWLGLLVPEGKGGVGLGLPEMAVIAQELGAIAAPAPFSACAAMTTVVLANCGAAAADRHLAALMSGQNLYALAWQEYQYPEQAEVGNTGYSAQKTATRVSKEATVSGLKRFVVTNGHPDYYIVSAQKGNSAILCLVAGDQPAVTTQTVAAVDGTQYQTVKFDAALISEILAEGDSAGRLNDWALETGILAASAELHAVSSSALELTLDYMRTRVQFGKAIGSFQALQHRAADLFIQKDLSYSVLQEALRIPPFDASQPRSSDRVSMVARAKARCSDAALLITKHAVQLHGAIGYTEEYDLSCFVKRAMVLASWLGSGTYQRRRYFDAVRSQ